MTTVADTGRIAVGFVLGAAAVALATRLLVDAPARDALGFSFGGIPNRIGEAFDVFVHNARLVAAVVGASLLVSAPWRVVRRIVDMALIGVVLANAAIVGVSIGAYGSRMVSALLPHGPVEVLAVSVAGSVYVAARRGPVQWRTASIWIGVSLVGLAVAAVLETYWG